LPNYARNPKAGWARPHSAECFDRAARIDIRKSKGGLYVRRGTRGELLLYPNETDPLIGCTDAEE
jgi:hypothetical protein